MVELVNFQINQQFSMIKDYIVETCENWNHYPISIEKQNYISFEQLGAQLHSLWRSARLQVFKFSATRKKRSSPRLEGTVPAASLRELYLRNELTMILQWGNKRRRLEEEIFSTIKQARQLFKYPDNSWRRFSFEDSLFNSI